ncbi:MAG: hypothetical protein QOJ85_663 [Solirubrobacteraceae bacterium]|nr:hypothetical protein [Solirubrobacteraceae bacterium]
MTVGAPGRSAGPVTAAPAMIRAAVAAVVVLAAAGLGLGVRVIVAGPSDAHPTVAREPPAPHAWEARASFGPVAAERVERSIAHTFDAHHGSTSARSDEVVVSVRVRNGLTHAVPFSAGEFRLLALGRGTTVTPIRPLAPPASISAQTTLRTQISFLVPVAYRSFALVFDDALGARPLRIALGVVPAPPT